MTVEMERKVGEEKVGIFRMSTKILKGKGSISRNFSNQNQDIRLAWWCWACLLARIYGIRSWSAL